MPNKSGNAYSLVTLCPIQSIDERDDSPVFSVRKLLQDLPSSANGAISPMARVPNTYLARFFILDDLIFQGFPYHQDDLKSKYLVFTANFYGDLDQYLAGMYEHAKTEVDEIWKHCIAFEQVKSKEGFVAYIKKCQLETTFYFNGSTDDSLQEQLKSLYIKQEFSKFVFSHQGAPAAEVLNDFKEFCRIHKPGDLIAPTWAAGIA